MMKILRISMIVYISFAITGCTKESAQDSPPEVRVDVQTAIVRVGGIEETVTATGSTTIKKETQMRSPIAGVLLQFKLYAGDRVQKRETIAQVRPKESEASLHGAEELLLMAKTEKQIEEAKQALELAQKAINTVNIRAPFDGIVSSKAKNEMEVVAEGEPIATIIDPTSIIFVADVSSSSYHRIRTGQPAIVRFTAKPGKLYRAAVHRIEPQVNPNDQTARVQVAFTGVFPELEGSLFGEVFIVVGKKDHVLMVPAAALLHDDENNTTSVMIVGSDSLAIKVNVTIGATNDSLVEVSSPHLSAGNVVITQGSYGLSDSTRVRIVK